MHIRIGVLDELYYSVCVPGKALEADTNNSNTFSLPPSGARIAEVCIVVLGKKVLLINSLKLSKSPELTYLAISVGNFNNKLVLESVFDKCDEDLCCISFVLSFLSCVMFYHVY